MLIGFKTGQARCEWKSLREMWTFADEELDVFASAWHFDHFDHNVEQPGDRGGSLEAFTLASALAAATHRLRIGHLVLGNTHRHPALLAKMATTLDHVAEGRFVVGLGAGWNVGEHEMYGWRLPPVSERLAMLEATVRILKMMWTTTGRFSLDAGFYRLRDVRCEPLPFTVGGPKIWLGTQGARVGLRIVAALADGWNSTGAFSEFLRKRDALYRHCDEIGRDRSEIEISVQVLHDGDSNETLDEARQYVRERVSHIILYTVGCIGIAELKRLADEVAVPLRDAGRP
jgi:alkanesulfonate monooxygenase SsuD/methylene tetrahydromethanopterin reductase-like flavin-dependent oxidoreductase (luciferase family)